MHANNKIGLDYIVKKKLDLSVVIFLLAVAILGTFTISYLFFSDSWIPAKIKRNEELDKLSDAIYLIESNFIGDYNREDVLDGAVAGMVASLNDQWSFYLTAEEYDSYYQNMNNQYTGIGIVIKKEAGTEGITINSVYKNSPAYEAGIMPDSIIVSVDGIDIADMELSEVSQLMSDKIKQGSLKIEIIDKNNNREAVTLVPSVVQVDPVSYRLIENDIGLITIENFDARASSQFISAIESLIDSGAKGFIFDVRNNPGGQLGELLTMLDYLLPEGTIFISRTKGEEPRIEKSDGRNLNMPMTVLINSNSYSAAEFFAAALQEYEWATVIGEKTTGKGYAQRTVLLSDKSAIHISTSEYFTPKGNSLAGKGMVPDIEVEMDEEKKTLLYYEKLESADDNQLQRAIRELNN